MATLSSESVLAEAEACDARGDHDEAVNVLARATGGGDELARIRLGKRLLVGDRAPYLPREGAGLVLEAARAGVAEAVCLVAVFQAIGLYQPKDWRQALSTLAYAAALGSAVAREQLVLLAGAGEPAQDPDLLAPPEADFWMGYPANIDLPRWLAAPPGIAVHGDPLVKRFPGLLPAAVCRWLIRLARPRLKPALVYDAVDRRNYRSASRNNSIAEFPLVENEVLHFMVQERMSAACGLPIKQMEGTAILHYQPGQKIAEHFDFVDPELPNYREEIAANGQRVITFLIYLNDDYQEGATAFPKLGISHKGGTGEGLYFVNALPDGAPDLRTLHAGSPPLEGEKWIVSQFIRDREVKYVL